MGCRDLVKLCRPHEWVKNSFVIAPLLFVRDSWNAQGIGSVGLAAFAFCLLSSSVYCLNDVLDAKADAAHPKKRQRPVASGRVSRRSALALSAFLFGAAIALSLWLPVRVTVVELIYAANSLFYVLILKHRVIADVLCIAIGFVLRLVAGCAALAIEPSSWLLLCGFSLALLIGFGKRRLELATGDEVTRFRHTLVSYSPEKLDVVLSTCASTCLVSYMLYTVSPETVALHGTAKLAMTVPIVMYGVIRYIFKVQEGRHYSPGDVILGDWVFLANGLVWAAAVVAILATARPAAQKVRSESSARRVSSESRQAPPDTHFPHRRPVAVPRLENSTLA